MRSRSAHHVVIIGGGFGGLHAAQSLKRAPVQVTLIDKRNFHLFQPLLYQVASGGLSPGDISSPLRAVLQKHANTSVIMAEVTDILPTEKRVLLRDGEVSYDKLVVATGASHHYFGNEQWREFAPGLKSIEDALDIRRRILLAFEAAEREDNAQRRRALLRFVVVGGGPTGVELAGALAELSHATLKRDFRSIDPTKTEILLVEGAGRLLPPYPETLSAKAKSSLEKLGVQVWVEARVTNIEKGSIVVEREGRAERLECETVLWAAGMQASALGDVLSDRTRVERDRSGRLIVQPDLSLPGHPDIFVIGDLAHFAHQGDHPLPGVAPVAIQQGRYVAQKISQELQGRKAAPFHYVDKGSLAVIGRHAAVAHLGRLKFTGYPAWLAWLFVHITHLIGFDNKLMVLIQWAWNYFTRKEGARLITGADPYPLVDGKR